MSPPSWKTEKIVYLPLLNHQNGASMQKQTLQSIKNIWSILKLSFTYFISGKITKHSASLAYYTIFSLPGMMLIIVTVIKSIYGPDAIAGRLYPEIQGAVGSDAARQIQELIKNAAISGESVVATTIGIATLIIGATTMFGEMQDSINLIWNLKVKPKKGWLRMIINRLISFSMVLILGFLLLISFVISGLVGLLSDHLVSYFPEATLIAVYVINYLLSFVITALLFTIIFRVLPDARIRWKDVMVGAVVTTVLFMIGKFLIGFYMGKSNVGSAYGAAGSIIVILLWVYYSAIILYYGVAFTKAYVQHLDHRIYPVNAVWVKEVEISSTRHLNEVEPLPPDK